MKKILNEGNQLHNFISSSGSDFLTNYGSGSTSQKVTVPTVPVPVPQHWLSACHCTSTCVICPMHCIGKTRKDSCKVHLWKFT